MDTWIPHLLQFFSLPEVGLGTVFVVALVSATLLPMGSEPAVFALVKLNPDLFWPAVLVATVGNTIGGAISWGMGYGVHGAVHQVKPALSEFRRVLGDDGFLVIACPDRVGIVAKVSSFLATYNGWITEASHHSDNQSGWFFMRHEIRADSLPFDLDGFRQAFAPIAREFSMEWRVTDSAQKKRVHSAACWKR